MGLTCTSKVLHVLCNGCPKNCKNGRDIQIVKFQLCPLSSECCAKFCLKNKIIYCQKLMRIGPNNSRRDHGNWSSLCHGVQCLTDCGGDFTRVPAVTTRGLGVCWGITCSLPSDCLAVGHSGHGAIVSGLDVG